eukprot:7159552-Prymnesium_polylepis.1
MRVVPHQLGARRAVDDKGEDVVDELTAQLVPHAAGAEARMEAHAKGERRRLRAAERRVCAAEQRVVP